MKVRVPAAAPAVPPETGASRGRRPAAAASAAMARALSTSTVEQSRKSVPGRAAGTVSAVDGAEDGAVREHGDDGVAVAGGLGGGGGGGDALDGDGGGVEAGDGVAGGGEVLRHGGAHVAEADEADAHGGSSWGVLVGYHSA